MPAGRLRAVRVLPPAALDLTPAQRPTGRIEGASSSRSPSPRRPRRRPMARGASRSRHARTGSELSNVVVFIQDPPKPPTLPPTRARILQENETFIPRVVAITRGSTVDFPNGDPFFHDVFSLSRSGTFDLGSYPSGQTKSHLFRKAGLVKVYCHIHSHMSASIMVFDHPFFTIPKADGSFAIDDVPAGHLQGQRLARAHRREQPAGPDRGRPGLRDPVRAADSDQIMASRTPPRFVPGRCDDLRAVVLILVAVCAAPRRRRRRRDAGARNRPPTRVSADTAVDVLLSSNDHAARRCSTRPCRWTSAAG